MNEFEKLIKEAEGGFDDSGIERLKSSLNKASQVYKKSMMDQHDPIGIYDYAVRPEVRPGQKYARLVATQVHTQTGVEVNKYVFGFASCDGEIFSASNWNNPNKYKSQGSLEDLETLKDGAWSRKIK